MLNIKLEIVSNVYTVRCSQCNVTVEQDTESRAVPKCALPCKTCQHLKTITLVAAESRFVSPM